MASATGPQRLIRARSGNLQFIQILFATPGIFGESYILAQIGMATTKKRSYRGLALSISFILALILIFWAARSLLRQQPPVRVATAHYGDLLTTVSTNGKVQPQFNFEAHAPFSGLIKAVYVHPGALVTKGQLLLSMDDSNARTQLASAYAALKGAEASYTVARSGGTASARLQLESSIRTAQTQLASSEQSLATLRKLETTGAAAPDEVASAEQQVSINRAELASLKAQQGAAVNTMDVAHAQAALHEAQQAYAAAETVLSQCNVRAPFDGTVYAIPVTATEYVDGGSLLLNLADLKHLQVRAYFDEPEIGKLAVGQPLTIRWDARPDQVWHGHLLRLPSSIITFNGTRNVGEALVSIDDTDGKLIPDTNVTVTVTVANLKNVLIVPRDALHAEQGQSYVYRVIDGKLRKTPVTVGSLNLTNMQITDGLKAGDTVVLGSEASNGVPLSNGLPVEVDHQ